MASPCTGDMLGCEWSRKFRNFLPWPGFEPRTSQSNGRERYHSITTHPQENSDFARQFLLVFWLYRIVCNCWPNLGSTVLFWDYGYIKCWQISFCTLCKLVNLLKIRGGDIANSSSENLLIFSKAIADVSCKFTYFKNIHIRLFRFMCFLQHICKHFV